uniref:Uncharacterized protein n=1 Tax=Craspedostauros australis TaxID=1486917 RepID=A0A6T6GTJ9_9STRA|mmetsp:Transcript_515/g.1454  ORF Transcript_515/g.1454 Transcript_515/m.1454 type:complete len:270 (+) Transcript_515:717-1526(+)
MNPNSIAGSDIGGTLGFGRWQSQRSGDQRPPPSHQQRQPPRSQLRQQQQHHHVPASTSVDGDHDAGTRGVAEIICDLCVPLLEQPTTQQEHPTGSLCRLCPSRPSDRLHQHPSHADRSQLQFPRGCQAALTSTPCATADSRCVPMSLGAGNGGMQTPAPPLHEHTITPSSSHHDVTHVPTTSLESHSETVAPSAEPQTSALSALQRQYQVHVATAQLKQQAEKVLAPSTLALHSADINGIATTQGPNTGDPTCNEHFDEAQFPGSGCPT